MKAQINTTGLESINTALEAEKLTLNIQKHKLMLNMTHIRAGIAQASRPIAGFKMTSVATKIVDAGIAQGSRSHRELSRPSKQGI